MARTLTKMSIYEQEDRKAENAKNTGSRGRGIEGGQFRHAADDECSALARGFVARR
jgi:hypothetical protein